MSSTQKIKLRRADGRVTLHVVEIIDYHVAGWKRARCLPHGEQLGPVTDTGDDTQTAIGAARQCARQRRLPFAPHREPLAPSVGLPDRAAARAAALDAAEGLAQ